MLLYKKHKTTKIKSKEIGTLRSLINYSFIKSADYYEALRLVNVLVLNIWQLKSFTLECRLILYFTIVKMSDPNCKSLIFTYNINYKMFIPSDLVTVEHGDSSGRAFAS